MKKIFPIYFAFFLMSANSQAVTINIPGNYPTIQAGIIAAVDGDTVLVDQGTYNEHINFLGKDIVVISQHGPVATLIDPEAIGAAVTFTEGAGSGGVIEGFTLSNSYYLNTGRYSGVSCEANSTPTIRGNTIANNGGIWALGGGGIYCHSASPIIEDNAIYNNECAYDGGGIFLENCTEAVIFHNVIMGNNVTSGYGSSYGGGICMRSSSAIVSRNIICYNTTDINFSVGGGIYLADQGYYEITNNTISGNAGAGVKLVNCDSTILFINNIIVNNTIEGGLAVDFVDTLINADYNDIWQNFPLNYYGCRPGLNDISADPEFTGGPSHNFYLSSTSPCIDAGDPNSPLDPDSTIADIGAEYFNQGIILPDIMVSLTPVNPPIQIPAGGGSFDFNVTITNNDNAPLFFSAWVFVTLPDSSVYGPIINAGGLALAPGYSIYRERTQNVPGNAPAGLYTYDGYVGVYPDQVWNEDLFDFEKLETLEDGRIVSDWVNWGEDFDSSIEESKILNFEFLILNCFPNPFNASTAISYKLQAASCVNLTIYDITGREIAILEDGIMPAGSHQVVFDADGLTSGVYFARLEAGEFRQTQKLLLIK